MMSFQRCVGALVIAVLLAPVGAATAQIPDEFTNLKMLPEDIGKRELMTIMRGWAGALGKRCNYCHVGEPGASLKDYDFASDKKEAKVTARTMMKMVRAINTTYLTELNEDDVIRVTCQTCHHGVSKPQKLSDIVLATVEEDGLDAGVAKYREMREEYYGRGAYNFSQGPLNTVAETIAASDIAAAITIMKVNLEFNGEAFYPHVLLGQIYMQSGDKAAAIASIETALKIDPENKWAQGLLKRIQNAE